MTAGAVALRVLAGCVCAVVALVAAQSGVGQRGGAPSWAFARATNATAVSILVEELLAVIVIDAHATFGKFSYAALDCTFFFGTTSHVLAFCIFDGHVDLVSVLVVHFAILCPLAREDADQFKL